MGLPYPPKYRHLEELLFVTTEAALGKLSEAEHPDLGRYGEESVQSLLGTVGDEYLLSIDGDPVDFEMLRARLNRDPAVKGVVILGDYATLPPRLVTVATSDEFSQVDDDDHQEWAYGDNDSWIVWSDDQYGDANGDTVAEKPVSRLPIVPLRGGILGDERRASHLTIPQFGGLRSEEFNFADEIYFRFLDLEPEPGDQDTMLMSPPVQAFVEDRSHAAAGAQEIDTGADIAAERLYLQLHSYCRARSSFQGDGGDGVGVEAITLEILETPWETRGVTFAGACWGALVGSTAMLDKQPADAWPVADSVALSFLDRGTTAFIGFTALHYAPYNGWTRGGALHCAVWKNIVERRWPPAKALHEARLRFMADSGTRSPDAFLRAVDRKTFWSASCLGLGWHPEPTALVRRSYGGGASVRTP